MNAARYRVYLLSVLAVLYAFNLMDMSAFGIALQSIKVALHLSDTRLGLLSGVAFSFFYSTFGVVLGRWADRGDRVTILVLTRILWGTFVILTGRARSFLELLIVRMSVGVGESGCLPPAYSLISDYFSRRERPRALGLFFLGGPLAVFLGFFSAGWLIQIYGWRVMFALMGSPGLILAAFVWLTVVEPRRGTSAQEYIGGQEKPCLTTPNVRGSVSAPPSFAEALQALYANATYRNLALALVVSYFFSGGVYQWQAAFFIRSYGLQSGELGMWLAVAYGIPGMIGTIVGGLTASRWAGGNERLQLTAVAALYCVAGVTYPFVYLTRSYHVAFSLIGLATCTFALVNGPLFATLQTVAPARARAMSIMIVFFLANLIGAGLGPLVVGALSDSLRPIAGVNSLRYSLFLMSPWFFWCGWHVWRARRSVVRDIEAVDRNA